MKRIYICILSLFLAVCSYASNFSIRANNAYTHVENTAANAPINYVFIFPDLKDASVTFYKDYEPYNIDTLFSFTTSAADKQDIKYYNASSYSMLDEQGYIAKFNDSTELSFWVIDYAQHRLDLQALEVVQDYEELCSEVKLRIVGELPDLQYRTQYGSPHTISREAQVRYTTLSWTGEQWQDSAVVQQLSNLHREFLVDAPLRDTRFSLSADQFLEWFGQEKDTIASDLYEAVAVAVEPSVVITTRGTENENEFNRPIEETQESPISGSAPLEILFRSNATPVVQSYLWLILKGNDLIARRTDADHRYTFDEHGEYVVKLVARGMDCETDTVEFAVSVSASKLLVPNVFTPNGDGKNDEFRVAYESIVEFDCWIYNRWGKLVYHWSDPAKGWDGTINGKPAAEGAYYYVIRAKGADAEGSDYKSKAKYKKNKPVGVYQLSGDINLLRGKR